MCPPCELMCCAWNAVYIARGAWGSWGAWDAHREDQSSVDFFLFRKHGSSGLLLVSTVFLHICHWSRIQWREKKMTPAVYHEQWSRPKTRSHDYGSSTRSGCPGSVHAVASALLTGSQGLPAALTWHHLPFLISFLLRGIGSKMELVSGISHKAQKEKRTCIWWEPTI